MNNKSGMHLRLERELSVLGYDNTLKALDLVVEEMNASKGFARHDGTHYYEHLISVTQFLLNFGYKNDEDLLTASILHDIVEDVEGYSIKLIEREFNRNVAEIVKLVTKKKGVNYKEDNGEMENYLEGILGNRYACLLKTADRIHNFSTLQNSSKSHRKAQLDNTIRYFIPFFKECRKLYVRDEALYYHARDFIKPLAYEIERYIKDVEKLEEELTKIKGE